MITIIILINLTILIILIILIIILIIIIILILIIINHFPFTSYSDQLRNRIVGISVEHHERCHAHDEREAKLLEMLNMCSQTIDICLDSMQNHSCLTENFLDSARNVAASAAAYGGSKRQRGG